MTQTWTCFPLCLIEKLSCETVLVPSFWNQAVAPFSLYIFSLLSKSICCSPVHCLIFTPYSSLLCVSRSWRKPCQSRTWTFLGTSSHVCCRDVTSAPTSRTFQIQRCSRILTILCKINETQCLSVWWHLLGIWVMAKGEVVLILKHRHR